MLYQPWLTVVGAILVATGVIAANSGCSYLVPIILVIISIVLVAILKWPRLLVSLSIILFLVFAYARFRAVVPASDDVSVYLNHTAVLTVMVLDGHEAGSKFAGRHFLKVRVLELIFPRRKISGLAQLLIITSAGTCPSRYEPGEIMQIKGQICPLAGYEQPWLSGLATMYARQNIFCQIEAYSSDITILGKNIIEQSLTEIMTKKLTMIIDQIRQNVTAAHLHFLGVKAGGLLASMVLGDQAVSLDPRLLDAFRKIGLSHIVAASGFNLTVVTMMTYWILHVLCFDKRLVTIIVASNVVVYAALAGLSASIVRAGITCLLVLVAKYFNRRLHGPAALSMGLIINMIIDPTALTEPGGQLSYAATAGIIFGAQTVADVLSFGSSNKFIKMFICSLAVVLMAQLAVLPVQLFHFWQMGLLFLPANLLIDPFVTPVTIAGFLASVASILNFPNLLPGLIVCRCLDWLAAIPLQIIIGVTEKLASFDLAVLNTGRPMTAAIILYYVMFAIWLISLQKERFRLLSTVLFVFSLLSLFYQPQLKRPIIIIESSSIICINEHRRALCFGSTNRQTNKVLAYYGADKGSLQKGYLPLACTEEEQIRVQTINEGGLLLIVDKTGRSESNRRIYAVILAKAKKGNEQLKSRFRHNETLSKSQFRSQLKPIDFKMCYPGKAVRFYSLGGATSFSSSVL